MASSARVYPKRSTTEVRAWQGPARGTRTRLGLDATISALSARQFVSAYWDLRNYQRLGRRFVFASRLFGIGDVGRDAYQYYIGGELVRGYRWGEFYSDAGPALGFGSIELRCPFVDRLDLAFPLPISFGGIRGVAFLDGGLVVRDGMRVWHLKRDARFPDNLRLDDLKLGTGVGIDVKRLEVTERVRVIVTCRYTGDVGTSQTRPGDVVGAAQAGAACPAGAPGGVCASICLIDR